MRATSTFLSCLSCYVRLSSACLSYYSVLPDEYTKAETKYKFDLWDPPRMRPEGAQDEAIMLIGGKRCQSRICSFNYTRINGFTKEFKTKNFPSHDNTIKFFTKYGFCRAEKSQLPILPDNVVSSGAVALPDGRVLICGGTVTKLVPGGRIEARTSTSCWYWVQGTTLVKRMAFWNKLPFQVGPGCFPRLLNEPQHLDETISFQWLGPFTSKQMQVVNFRPPVYDEDAREFWAEEEAKESKRIKPGSQEIVSTGDKIVRNEEKFLFQEYEWDLGTEPAPTLDPAQIPTTTTAAPEPVTDAQGNTVYRRSQAEYLESLTEFSRIVILPWPPYTNAFKGSENDRLQSGGGEVIEGRMTISDFGPRIQWTRHPLQDMPLGYGGCFVMQYLFDGRVRFHSFGGRELFVDQRLNDQGWTQEPHHLNKYPRYFDVALNLTLSLDIQNQNRTFGLLFPQEGHVTRSTCEAENATFDERREAERKYLVLEEDRIFHTCHFLPEKHFGALNGTTWDHDIILIGGGTGTFYDRPRILNANYDHTPIYRSIARYDLRPDKDDLIGCQEPDLDGKGRWITEEKTFGYGLNIPRTRHASEIIRTTDPRSGEESHNIFVFGGYTDERGGQILDSVERFQLGNLSSFHLYDFQKDENEWLFRLPWPLMDITSVKIPVEWLPEECYIQYARGRRREKLEKEQIEREQSDTNLDFGLDFGKK